MILWSFRTSLFISDLTSFVLWCGRVRFVGRIDKRFTGLVPLVWISLSTTWLIKRSSFSISFPFVPMYRSQSFLQRNVNNYFNFLLKLIIIQLIDNWRVNSYILCNNEDIDNFNINYIKYNNVPERQKLISKLFASCCYRAANQSDYIKSSSDSFG